MQHDDLIAEFERGAADLRQAIAGMTAEQLRAAPVPGKWSTHQVIIHLADAEQAFTHRIKRILAEDRPTYNKWEENDFVSRLCYADQSAEDAMTTIEVLRRQLARILRKMPADVLERKGVHSQAGEQTAREVIDKDIWHLQHHLKFVQEKRKALGL